MDSYDEEKNLKRVADGWKGGPFFKLPAPAPAMKIVQGYPAETVEKMKGCCAGMPQTGKIIDGWATRRAGK